MAIVGGTATPLMAHMNTLNFTVEFVISDLAQRT
jgi:hypothetical protein